MSVRIFYKVFYVCFIIYIKTASNAINSCSSIEIIRNVRQLTMFSNEPAENRTVVKKARFTESNKAVPVCSGHTAGPSRLADSISISLK